MLFMVLFNFCYALKWRFGESLKFFQLKVMKKFAI